MFYNNEEDRIYADLRRQNRMNKIDEFKDNAGNFVMQNLPVILGGVTIVSAGAAAVSDLFNSIARHNQKKIERDRRTSVYDRSNGVYLKLKRPLNNSDWRKINSMKAKGFKQTEAMERLGLIK